MTPYPENPKSGPASAAAAFALYGIGTGLFALDIATPLGIADGTGYAPLVGVSYWLRGAQYSTNAVAALFSTLVIVAQFIGHGGLGNAALLNRMFALIAIWTVALLVIRLKRRS
jgi:hypothetical protein